MAKYGLPSSRSPTRSARYSVGTTSVSSADSTRASVHLGAEGPARRAAAQFPYLVMELVEGEALYEWAARRNPSSRQVLRVVAQVARALAATHEAGGVHRDVKGANVLVRPGDGRAYLTDFGAGHYRRAATLTSKLLPPGTPAYRSPEAWAFLNAFLRHPTAHYPRRAALFHTRDGGRDRIIPRVRTHMRPDMPRRPLWPGTGWPLLWKSTCVCLTSVLLMACASSPRPSSRRDLRLDTETVSRVRHAAAATETTASLTASTARAVASNFIRIAPVLIELLGDEYQASQLEEALVECARQAEKQVNTEHFGGRAPTRQECGEEIGVDGCAEPITRAMLLGQQKHALALQCAQDVLKELWPASFSLEQRYRFYPSTRFLEVVSKREEELLLAQGCTQKLWRTIKPDIVLHPGYDVRQSLLTLEFKFPCPDTNEPRWTVYGESSAYVGSTQKQVYEDALGGQPLMISPKQEITE